MGTTTAPARVKIWQMTSFLGNVSPSVTAFSVFAESRFVTVQKVSHEIGKYLQGVDSGSFTKETSFVIEFVLAL